MVVGALGDARPDDGALVEAARIGSVRAFESLVERYHAPLLRHLARQTGDRELAADVTQEAFVDAYRHLDRLADDRPFAAWLYRIARNHMLSELRRRRLRRALSLEWAIGGGASDDAGLRGRDSTASTGERDAIQRALDTLSPPLREALLLHTLWGYPSQEVGQMLGITPEAARQRVGRARAQFRDQYQAMNGVDDVPNV